MTTKINLASFYERRTLEQLKARKSKLQSEYKRILNHAFNGYDCCRIRSEIEIIDAELERRGGK